MTDTAILELKAVTKRLKTGLFKRLTVIKDLSCQLRLDRCTALLGHNGAGKTTTIRMLLGLIRPDQGEILFRGHPMNRRDRARIGYMPEVSKLPMNLTCEEVLRHQLWLCGHKDRAPINQLIDARLDAVGLAQHRKKRVAQLSKGMARRLGWAQATIHEPEFLILDEPFSGLDPLARLEMQAWLGELKRRQVGILICTHEFWSVSELCDELYIMNRGGVVFTSTAIDELGADPNQREQQLLRYFA